MEVIYSLNKKDNGGYDRTSSKLTSLLVQSGYNNRQGIKLVSKLGKKLLKKIFVGFSRPLRRSQMV